ncbi:MAG: hypothetical protein PHW04_08645 [Candidatus Wallbacteria bacterium]|nr:hypothetical protein [Candidatus Wallbacteria bacterium]
MNENLNKENCQHWFPILGIISLILSLAVFANMMDLLLTAGKIIDKYPFLKFYKYLSLQANDSSLLNLWYIYLISTGLIFLEFCGKTENLTVKFLRVVALEFVYIDFALFPPCDTAYFNLSTNDFGENSLLSMNNFRLLFCVFSLIILFYLIKTLYLWVSNYPTTSVADFYNKEFSDKQVSIVPKKQEITKFSSQDTNSSAEKNFSVILISRIVNFFHSKTMFINVLTIITISITLFITQSMANMVFMITANFIEYSNLLYQEQDAILSAISTIAILYIFLVFFDKRKDKRELFIKLNGFILNFVNFSIFFVCAYMHSKFWE